MAATALVAGTLAPALSVMRAAMTLSREAVERQRVANYAVRALETHAASAMRAWAPGVDIGNFAADGHAEIRYTVVKTDALAGGGLLNRLMQITVTAYHDNNGNLILDAGEPHVTMRTKIANLASYANAPL